MDMRIAYTEEKLKNLDVEISTLRSSLAKARSQSEKNRIKMKAVRCLKQKKILENQIDQMYQQQSVLDQTQFMTQQIKDTSIQIQALRSAKVSIDNELKGFDADSIEDLQEELEDMFFSNNEIQDVLSRQYELPLGIDEDALEQEFLSLEDDMLGNEFNSVPSYLKSNTKESEQDEFAKLAREFDV